MFLYFLCENRSCCTLKKHLQRLLTKVCLVKAMVFPVVMYGCESSAIKKAEHWRIDAFENCGVGEDFESPLYCMEIKPVNTKGNQPWIFIGRNDAEDETPILLATWCEELTHWKRPWCWDKLNAEGDGDNRGQDGFRALLSQWTWVWVNSLSWQWTGKPGMLQSIIAKSWTWLSN